MWIKHFIMIVVGATRIEIGHFILGCGIIFLVADGVNKLLKWEDISVKTVVGWLVYDFTSTSETQFSMSLPSWKLI